MVHEAGAEEPLRREWRVAEPRSRSVLAALQPAAATGGGAAVGGGAGPGGAVAAYLGAARYVAGGRIDTSLFQPLSLRPHRGELDSADAVVPLVLSRGTV